MQRGQLVRIHTKDNNGTGWRYGVAFSVYDNVILYHDDRMKWYSNSSEGDGVSEEFNNRNFQITELFKGGQPVFAKKKWFGDYKLDIKYYQFD